MDALGFGFWFVRRFVVHGCLPFTFICQYIYFVQNWKIVNFERKNIKKCCTFVEYMLFHFPRCCSWLKTWVFGCHDVWYEWPKYHVSPFNYFIFILIFNFSNSFFHSSVFRVPYRLFLVFGLSEKKSLCNYYDFWPCFYVT